MSAVLSIPFKFPPIPLIDHAQLYAQLKTLLEQGERYWMNKEEEAAWKKVNQSFYRISAEEDVCKH